MLTKLDIHGLIGRGRRDLGVGYLKVLILSSCRMSFQTFSNADERWWRQNCVVLFRSESRALRPSWLSFKAQREVRLSQWSKFGEFWFRIIYMKCVSVGRLQHPPLVPSKNFRGRQFVNFGQYVFTIIFSEPKLRTGLMMLKKQTNLGLKSNHTTSNID